MTTPLLRFEADEVHATVPSVAPHRVDDRDPGFLYALQFESGLVKVGRAVRARDRVISHRRILAATNGQLVRGWVSPAHLNYIDTEKTLIACGHVLAERWLGQEYLYGAELNDLAEAAEHLSYELLSDALPPPHGPHFPGLMRAYQFADLVGVRRTAIRRWMVERGVFHHYMGRSPYVPDLEVERVLRAKGERS